jgi:predicted nucleic acid-binding Zn ribbon protein
VGIVMALDRDAIERERQRRQRQRNFALAGVLAAFAIVVYVVTMIKMAGG